MKNTGPPSAYVELQVTTNFSFLHSGSHPEEFFQRAAELGYAALAVSDRNSLAGIVRAEMAAREYGLRLITGSQIIFSAREFSLLLYPTNLAGYQNLCRLLTLGKRRANKGECQLELADIYAHAPGLTAILRLHTSSAISDSELQALKGCFPDENLALGLARHYLPGTRQKEAAILALARRHTLPLVATNDALYHDPARRKLQDVLNCVRQHTTIFSAGRALQQNAERHLKSAAEMAHLFRDLPNAVRHSAAIAEQTSGFSLKLLRYEYPDEVVPPDLSAANHLAALTWAGAEQRYPRGIPDRVRDLLRHELQLIGELNYEKYFLTAHDIIQFARAQAILCQGRGAAANSAVCYCLGITAVDPQQIPLLFERFISRERAEPPDIDIDFEHQRREEVIQYIYRRYGRERAALTAAVITYRTRSAIHDVGKVFGLTTDATAQLIKDRRDKKQPTNSRLQTVLELAHALRGFPRHLSQHVGGFIISQQALSDLVPIENAAMEHRTIIEWDKDDIEALGILKIDVLALGMLSCLRETFALLKRQTGQQLSLDSVPADDPATYQMISRADTLGVFQIESRAQMSMLPRLKPRCFFDLVIEVAIVRPGPIQGGMVHPYLRRRSGKEPVSYPNDRLRRILGRTLGVPIFQEQIMELAVEAAGFTPGQADQLRRAMASWKRNKNLIQRFGEQIMSGMLARGYTRDFAERTLAQIKGFSEYGFPQSHAASFALLAYVSAWLKCHHPAAFAAALINCQPMGFYQPAQIIQDAAAHGVEILPIDVKHSDWLCTLEGPRRLRLGLCLVRGLQAAEALKIQAAARDFKTLLQLWRQSGVRAASLRLLARADAFTALGLSRQQALWQVRKLRDERLPLLDGIEEKELPVSLPEFSALAHVMQDYAWAGLSLRAHPLSFFRAGLSPLGFKTTAALRDEKLSPRGRRAQTLGLVLVRQRPSTASGVIFLTLEDEVGIVNCILRPELAARHPREIFDAQILAVSGRIQREDGVLHLLIETLSDYSALLQNFEHRSRDFH